MGYFKGKTIIVTGAGRCVMKDGRCGNIGYAIATELAKEGANLVITDVDDERLQAAKEELESRHNCKVIWANTPFAKDQDNKALAKGVVDKAIQTFGQIDGLVNCAIASASGIPFMEHTAAEMDLPIYTGLYATFHYMQECMPYLSQTKGSIVNFASGAGLAGTVGNCGYAAAKEAIRGMTRVAATEFGPAGINCNIICPLAYTARMEVYKEQFPEAFKANVSIPPLGRLGDPEKDIARVVVQLLGPDFKYMSGETIVVQGGIGLRP